MTPEEASRRYAELHAERQAGRLGEADFIAAVADLRFEDAAGAWWQIDATDGGWLLWDGAAWTKASPPLESATPAVSHCPYCGAETGSGLSFCSQCGAAVDVAVAERVTPGAVAAGAPERAHGFGRWGQRVWDVVTMVGCTGVSGAWAWYSGLAETQPDLKTCATIVLLPLGLIVFRRFIDRLLMPLKQFRERIPRLVRLGMGLGMPFLMSNYLYASGSTQFDYMFKTVLLSTLASFVILRNPLVPRLPRLPRLPVGLS